ncbi:MAG: alkaline phosphatase [Clostridia bacterium]|nr:alkaline phosphatase [Clostridia bacterium]
MERFRRLTALAAAFVLLFICALPAAAQKGSGEGIRNVIFMIGDGMGFNHLRLAEQEGYELFMQENADLAGESRTRSTIEVTDSAAGATALSAGVRTANACVGVYPSDVLGLFTAPRLITEAARGLGMRVGVVTTDLTSGATPAGFTAHTLNRNQPGEITRDQLKTGFDLIWGANEAAADPADIAAAGYTRVSSREDLASLAPGDKSFGQFSLNTWKLETDADDPSPTLKEMTEEALRLLSSDAGHGFFLMVEGAHIDKWSHLKPGGVADSPYKRQNAAEAVKAFDRAVEAAVDFARRDGHTLVIVTADHETGNLYAENGEYVFHSWSHTGVNVPVFVYGSDTFIENGQAVDNYELPVRVAKALGWDEAVFPAVEPGDLTDKLAEALLRLAG